MPAAEGGVLRVPRSSSAPLLRGVLRLLLSAAAAARPALMVATPRAVVDWGQGMAGERGSKQGVSRGELGKPISRMSTTRTKLCSAHGPKQHQTHLLLLQVPLPWLPLLLLQSWPVPAPQQMN